MDHTRSKGLDMHSGSCLCGSIRYEIKGELGEFGYCHCQSCRKASGSAFGANVGIERNRLRLEDPGDMAREFESSPGKIRVFCGQCGSPILAYLRRTPELVRIRLGSLDTAFAERARAHTFVSEKALWDVIEDEVAQFEQWAPTTVLEQHGSNRS